MPYNRTSGHLAVTVQRAAGAGRKKSMVP